MLTSSGKDRVFVTHFNSFLRGGASTAAQQLHRGLLSNEVSSRFQHLAGQAFADQGFADASDREFYPTKWSAGGALKQTMDAVLFRLHRQRFKRETRGAAEGAEVFTSPHGKPFTPWPPVDHPAANEGSGQQHIIHLHWISKFIDFPSFFGSLPVDQPVIWTLHDMNALSGGCHFAGGCERFRAGCGNCPQLKRSGQNDVSSRSLETKRRALESINLHVVAPSRWLLEQAQTSPVLSNARSFTRIPYGMPSGTLYPVPSELARAALGIDPDTFVICFGAMNLNSRRKGAAELMAALETVGSHSNVRCLVFGSGSLSGATHDMPEMIHVGKVEDDLMRRNVYSAADVFVLPSTEDNLPLTGLEAMACGTPVIGFDAGGIPDYVIPGKTGMLAMNRNPTELGRKLLEASRDPERMRVMGHQARQLILEQFESDLEAQHYLQLYRSALGIADPLARRAA